jgi:hypothetical protein
VYRFRIKPFFQNDLIADGASFREKLFDVQRAEESVRDL